MNSTIVSMCFPSPLLHCCKLLLIEDSKCICRFVMLIDVLYENQIRLFCSAEGDPMQLFKHIVTVSDARRVSKSNMVSHVCCAMLRLPLFMCKMAGCSKAVLCPWLMRMHTVKQHCIGRQT